MKTRFLLVIAGLAILAGYIYAQSSGGPYYPAGGTATLPSGILTNNRAAATIFSNTVTATQFIQPNGGISYYPGWVDNGAAAYGSYQWVFGSGDNIPDFTLDVLVTGVLSKRWEFAPEGELVDTGGYSDTGSGFPNTNYFALPTTLTNVNNQIAGHLTGASGTFIGSVNATTFAVISNNVAPTAASPTNGQFWFDGTDVYIYWTNFTTGLSGTNRIAAMNAAPTQGQALAYDAVNKVFYPTNFGTGSSGTIGAITITNDAVTTYVVAMTTTNSSGMTTVGDPLGWTFNADPTNVYVKFSSQTTNAAAGSVTQTNLVITTYASQVEAIPGGVAANSWITESNNVNGVLAMLSATYANAGWTISTNGLFTLYSNATCGLAFAITNRNAASESLYLTVSNAIAPVIQMADGANLTFFQHTNSGGNVFFATATPGTFIQGTTAGTITGSGFIGEVTNTPSLSTTLSLSTGTAGAITNWTIAPGSWLVWGNVNLVAANTTVYSNAVAGIGITSAANAVAGSWQTLGYGNSYTNWGTTSQTNTIVIPPQLINLSASTVYYLAVKAQFGVSSLTAFGQMTGLRIR